VPDLAEFDVGDVEDRLRHGGLLRCGSVRGDGAATLSENNTYPRPSFIFTR
jgi:hypothetical protein